MSAPARFQLFDEMPDHVRRYLRERFIGDEIVEHMGVQYAECWGKGWIAFPYRPSDEDVAYKLKALPGNDVKGATHPKGSKAALYGRRGLTETGLERVFVCEGEPDCLVLKQANLTAVTSTAGAATFHVEWLEDFPENVEVVLVFDADEAGHKGREKLRALILENRPDLRVSDVRFDFPGVKVGYDVTDFWRECTEKGDDPKDVFLSLIDEYNPVVEWEKGYIRPLAIVKPPKVQTDFAAWKTAILRHFPELGGGAEVCLSVVCQLLINNVRNPFALILVDVPSSGKTITLNFFEGIEEIAYSTDNFTPASLVSIAPHKATKDLAKADMLPQIRFKTLIVREMATIFSEREDDLRHKLGILTRVLDGEGYTVNSGIHGQRGYKGDYLFMVLGASVPMPLRVWKAMGTFGHRLFFLALGTPRLRGEKLEALLRNQNYKEKEILCKKITHDLLRTLWRAHGSSIVWDSSKDDPELIPHLARIATFAAHFRGEIIVYHERGDDGVDYAHTQPIVEQPPRIQQCLYNLACGHAVACGRTNATVDDLGPVVRVMLDTAPSPRPEILRQLLKNNGKISSLELSQKIGIAPQTARKELLKLSFLGLCVTVASYGVQHQEDMFNPNDTSEKNVSVRLADEFEWLSGDPGRQLFERLGIVLW